MNKNLAALQDLKSAFIAHCQALGCEATYIEACKNKFDNLEASLQNVDMFEIKNSALTSGLTEFKNMYDELHNKYLEIQGKYVDMLMLKNAIEESLQYGYVFIGFNEDHKPIFEFAPQGMYEDIKKLRK